MKSKNQVEKNTPEGELAEPEQISSVRRRSAAPYITVKEWEEKNKKKYPHYGPIWYYDAYGESWDFAFWGEQKGTFDKERTQKSPEHIMWKVDFEPLVMDINLPFPGGNDGIKYPLLEREIAAE